MASRTGRIFAPLHLVLAPALVLALAACSSSPEADATSDDALTTDGSLSYVGKAVTEALAREHSAEEGKTWNLSLGNSLSGNFVKQIPFAETWGAREIPVAARCKAGDSGCDADFLLKVCRSDADCGGKGRCAPLKATVAHRGGSPKSLCIGHSDPLLDDIYETITAAKESVDLSSLTPPDGRFEAAIRNALTFASESATPPRVRLIFGTFPGSGVNAKKSFEALTRDIPSGSRMDVSLAVFRDGVDTWNHSKVIVRDQNAALVGGTNLWDEHYLAKNPVHDMWIAVEGRAARDASKFIDELWRFTCSKDNLVDAKEVLMRTPGKACPDPLTRPTGNGSGGTPVIATGRLGAMGASPSDRAIVALVKSARKSVRLSQQDIGPVKRVGVSFAPWPEDLMRAMVAAMARGVDVSVILSNPKSVPGDVSAVSAYFNTYDNGWSLEAVGRKFIGVAEANRNLLGGKDPTALVCEKLRLMHLRMGPSETWPDGNTYANHVKSVVVDDRAFYVGSQNSYVANLAEFGYIVDDSRVAARFVSDYLEKAERFSARTAISGAGVACRLVDEPGAEPVALFGP